VAFPVVTACNWAERRLRPALRRLDVSPEQVQGLALDGFEQHSHAHFALVAFAGRQGLARCLRSFAVSAGDVRVSGPARALGLSMAGLLRLGLPASTLAGLDPAFREGVCEPTRSERLGDVGGNGPQHWRWGGPEQPGFDAAFLLYARSRAELERERQCLAGELERQRGTLVYELATEQLAGRKEHFGFRGGIAQPCLDSNQSDERRPAVLRRGPRHNTIAPGEILLGYTNEFGALPPSPLLPVALDPHELLPAAGGQRDLGKDGSYLVVRQLEQDVHGFWSALDRRAGNAGERDWLAAKLMGRWRSGAPLVLSPERDRPELCDADEFDYALRDPHGVACPFGAHIRRANPRDWRLAQGAEFSNRMSNQHRLIRRSRTYGAPLAPSLDPEDILQRGDDGAERGLLFMALNADLGRQFELLQEAWLNNPHYGRLRGEVDPILRAPDQTGSFTIQGQPAARRLQALPSFVRLRGSAYFFLPSLPALRFLAEWGAREPG
jgi:Dyp-type peroxidase family